MLKICHHRMSMQAILFVIFYFMLMMLNIYTHPGAALVLFVDGATTPLSPSWQEKYPECSLEASVDVRDFGAIGNGTFLNTKAFQQAVQYVHDKVEKGSSGCVLVHNGTYLVSGISLLSNVFLHVDSSATILGSYHYQDYVHPMDCSHWPLCWVVGGANANNTGVLGKGKLNGQALKFLGSWNATNNQLMLKHFGPPGHPYTPPSLVRFINSSFIHMKDITIEDSLFWSSHYLGCSVLHIEHVSVLGNPRLPWTDGMDIDSTSDVVIHHCHIAVGDDGICPKSTRGYGPTKRIHAYENTIQTRSCGIKYGSATPEAMGDALFENITILPHSHRGLGIQHRDEGNITNITFRNIFINFTQYWPDVWWGAAEPIWVTVAYRTWNGTKPGYLKNILFENVFAISENGVIVSGYHDSMMPQQHENDFLSSKSISVSSHLEGITFHNVHITVGKLANYTQVPLDNRPTYAPDMRPNPVFGFFVEYAKNIQTENCSVQKGLVPVKKDGGCFAGGNGVVDFHPEGIECL